MANWAWFSACLVTIGLSVSQDIVFGKRQIQDVLRDGALVGIVLSLVMAFSRSDSTTDEASLLIIAAGIAGGRAWRMLGNANPIFIPYGWVVIASAGVTASCVSVVFVKAGATYAYHGQTRWCGPWDNPNQFGLMTAICLFLSGFGAVGAEIFVSALKKEKCVTRRWVVAVRCFSVFTMIINIIGLLKSYSRGSAIALLAGCAWAFRWEIIRVFNINMASAKASTILWLGIRGAVIAGALLIVSLHYSNQPILARIRSIANTTDASWKNRMAAMNYGLQMLIDGPVTGTGFKGSVEMYEALYMPDYIHEPQALVNCEPIYISVSMGPLFTILLCGYVCLGGFQALRRGGSVRGVAPDRLVSAMASGTVAIIVAGSVFNEVLLSLPFSILFWVSVETKTMVPAR